MEKVDSPTQGTDLSVLTEALKMGDRHAFEYIYRNYWYRIFLVAYRKTKSKEIAEELVQELFLNLWKKKESLQIHQLENYLFTCIKNSILAYFESQSIKSRYIASTKTEIANAYHEAEQNISLYEINSALNKGLDSMPEKTKKVFQMSRFENLSIHEIAAKLKLSEKAVEYHLTKSLKLLKTLLKDFIISFLIITSLF